MHVSPVQNGNYPRSPTSLRNPPFPLQNHPSSFPSTASDLPSASAPNGSTTPQTSYRAPAHKHAHHLHSIPPREKSTRTLIIDHLLWVHGRTRFAQARAELGMSDRTGGPSSLNYIHRQRPENYEEEDDEGSDGEDASRLKAKAGDSNHPSGSDEDLRLRAQDLTLARELRLRAEGLEKVVTSMLEQPPPLPPINDEDIWTPPTSPRPKIYKERSHPHTLPNGVRLRLALATIVNDLFARQAPHMSYRHQLKHARSSTPSTQASDPSSGTSSSGLYPSSSILPFSLRFLSTISAAHSMAPPVYSTGPPSFPGYTPQSSQTRMQHPLPTSNPRAHLLYMAGADPSTANSPPSFRCPRHLHTGCEICVEAKTTRPVGFGSRGRQNTSSTGNLWRGMPGGAAPGGGGISGWQDSSGVGSGLLRPGGDGSCLRRKGDNEPDISGDGTSSNGAGNTRISELIPRFIKLSALVAAELGAEARDGEDDSSSMSKDGGTDIYAGNRGNWEQMQQGQQEHRGDYKPLPDPNSLSTPRTSSQDRMPEYALRPTREWYMLLAGLLTRAVLEGYLTAGWRGPQAVECLLTVGLGMAETADSEPEPRSRYEEFDPDDLPSLLDAMKLLFPAWRTAAPARKGQAEEEYEMEMQQRFIMFCDIPASTPDLSTHMEDLAWQYPAEPVERAAVRFCEAIARWRGKPELETYKRKPNQSSVYPDTPGNSLPMESLVHSNPTSPARVRRRPSIDVYFADPAEGLPVLFGEDTVWNGNKRLRSSDNVDSSPGKRIRGR